MRPLVRTLKSCKRNDWDTTVAKMHKMYLGDEHQDKYSCDSLEHFVARDRMITKKAHFINYHQKFCAIVHNLHDHVSEADQDHLFWKGLPKNLRRDIFQELRSDDKRDWRKAPTITQVYDEVTKRILDKDSVFANLTASQGKSKYKSKKHDLSKKKKHTKFDDLFSDDLDNESSDSEDEAPHCKSEKHSSKHKKRSSRDDSSDSDSSTDDESSSSDDSDSDSEISDDDFKYMGSSKKKCSSSCARAKDSKDWKSTKTSQRSSYSDVDQNKDEIANLTDRFRKLELMLGQKSDDYNIPQDASFVNDPTYRQVAQILQKAAQEVEETKNNAQIHQSRSSLHVWKYPLILSSGEM